ncbi:MAG: TM2 domain-containing protein [Treponema sp.]|jgi:TM2 domain-containing membrane protein YozV|nr:TM2 domain-containing protein [Treponema sp.]
MKSKLTAYLLCIFLGFWGGHRFYIGKIWTGVLYFFTFGLFGIGWLVDLITLSGQVDKYNGEHDASEIPQTVSPSKSISVLESNTPTTVNSHATYQPKPKEKNAKIT